MPVSTVVLWIKIASAVALIALGIMFAFAAHPATGGVANLFLDLLVWPIDGSQALSTQEGRIIAGIGGGITVGWGVMIWQVADQILPINPALGRKLVSQAMTAWFVVDSIASWFSGVPLNVVLNVVLLTLFLIPLYRMDTGQTALAS
ncbi:MAG: hypothetical protein ACRCU5_16055 [Rhizobiaceae bacterium]